MNKQNIHCSLLNGYGIRTFGRKFTHITVLHREKNMYRTKRPPTSLSLWQRVRLLQVMLERDMKAMYDLPSLSQIRLFLFIPFI